MKDDYSSGSFNSYNEVTRGSEKKCDTLFIDHIPITLTAVSVWVCVLLIPILFSFSETVVFVGWA